MKAKFTLTFLIIPFLIFSQIETKIDSSNILIGDQIQFTIKSNLNNLKNWKEFEDSIGNFEIIDKSKIDTAKSEDGWILSQNYTLTKWDSGTFFIPAIEIENSISDSLQVYVNTITTNDDELKDIKEPINTPITFIETLPYILLIIILALITYLVFYYLKNRKKDEVIVAKEPIFIPPFEIALALLRKLKDKDLLMQNEVKEYHTQISEILRRYIESGLKIQAMEISSKEIIYLLNQQRIDTKSIEKVFEVSDLAKFAKFKPLEIENKECLEMAILFVEQTKDNQDELQ